MLSPSSTTLDFQGSIKPSVFFYATELCNLRPSFFLVGAYPLGRFVFLRRPWLNSRKWQIIYSEMPTEGTMSWFIFLKPTSSLKMYLKELCFLWRGKIWAEHLGHDHLSLSLALALLVVHVRTHAVFRDAQETDLSVRYNRSVISELLKELK